MNKKPARPSRKTATAINILTQCSAYGFLIAQGVFLVPIYLHYIKLPVYGAWLASSHLLSWVILLDPGIDEAVRQRVGYAYGRGDLHEVGGFIGSGIVINIVAAFIVFLISCVTAIIVPKYLGLSGDAANDIKQSLFILGLAGAINVAAYSAGSPLLALQRSGLHGNIFLAGTVAAIASTVFLLRSGWGITAIPTGIAIRSAFWLFGWGVALCCLFRPKGSVCFRLHVSLKNVRQLAELSALTFLSKLSYSLQTGADGLLIGNMLGASETARYMLTGRVIDVARTFTDRIGSAVQPSLAHLFGEAQEANIKQISMRFAGLIGMVGPFLIALAVAFNRETMRFWVGDGIYAGMLLTILLGVAACFSAALNSGYHILFAAGEIRKATTVLIFQGLAKVAFAVGLLRTLGLIALPLSGLIAMSLIGLPLFWPGCVKLMKTNPSERKQLMIAFLKPFVICSGSAVALLSLRSSTGGMKTLILSLAFAVFLMVVLSLLHFPAREEARYVYKWLIAHASKKPLTAVPMQNRELI
jgi:O-antigen/teichoic acid export membrane protein